jgi:predicted RND superfamily exporter protein
LLPELQLASRDNIRLGAAGTVLILVFLVSLMINTRDAVKSSAGLAIGGLVCILLSMLAGIGFSLHMGVTFTPITLVILFLVLGVGVDDMLLLVACFDATETELPLEERNAKAMGIAGVFVTVSTTTTVLAFLAGSVSIFPAVAHFSISAALVMLMNYLNAVTIFNALMVLNERRIELDRFDCLCCKGKDLTAKRHADKGKYGFLGHLEHVRKADPTCHDIIEAFVVPSLFSKKPVTGEQQTNLTCFAKVLLVCMPIIAAVAVIYFVTHCKEGMDTKLVVTDDSSFAQYLDLVVSHFAHLGEHVQVCLYKGPESELDSNTFAIFDSTIKSLNELSVIEASATVSFWSAFSQFGSATSPSLLSDLLNFKTNIVPQFDDDIKSSSSTSIDAVRVHMYHQYLATSDVRLQAMESVRAVVDKANTELPDGHKVFAYANAYVLWDSYPLVRSEALASMLVAGLIVFGVLLLAFHPVVALQVVFVVVCIDCIMLGWIPLMGMQLHSVSTICIIMSVGLAVDFSAHIAHAFLEAEGTTAERSVGAIRQMMPSLCLGGFTTFLGILPLSVARVESSRIFFKMMSGVLMSGVVFGLIYLPALMAYAGPKKVAGGRKKLTRRSSLPCETVQPETDVPTTDLAGKVAKIVRRVSAAMIGEVTANSHPKSPKSPKLPLVRRNTVNKRKQKSKGSLPYENLVFSGGGTKCSVIHMFCLDVLTTIFLLGLHGCIASFAGEGLSPGVQALRWCQCRFHDRIHVCPQF